MAQKPQRRSHPSATLTYAHGASDGGTGQVQEVERRRRRQVGAHHRVRPVGAARRRRQRDGHAEARPPGRPRAGRRRARSPWRSARHPVTTRRAPSWRAAASSRMVSIDSWRAASMKAQVLTTTRSASLGRRGRLVPVAPEGPHQLVRVDLVLRTTQGLQPVSLGHQDNLPAAACAPPLRGQAGGLGRPQAFWSSRLRSASRASAALTTPMPARAARPRSSTVTSHPVVMSERSASSR